MAAATETEMVSSVTEHWLMNQKSCISCKKRENRTEAARVSGANIQFCGVTFTFSIILKILWGEELYYRLLVWGDKQKNWLKKGREKKG